MGSSMDVPEGFQAQSPSDNPSGVDPLDAAERASYNASVRVAGSVLRPRKFETATLWANNSQGGCLYANGGNPSNIYNTPIYLPQGSIVRFFRMYFYDTNSSYNSTAWLSVYDLFGNLVREHLVISSGSSGNNYATTEEIAEEINYESYSYVINWRPNDLGSDMQVCGFRIYYQAPPGATYLPFIINGE